jgi:hypothetical protein
MTTKNMNHEIFIRAKIGLVGWNVVIHDVEKDRKQRKQLRQVGISPEVVHMLAWRARSFPF